MKAPTTTARTKPLLGISVREIAKAIGTAKQIETSVTAAP